MHLQRSLYSLIAACLLLQIGCGEGTVKLGGDRDDTETILTVTGTLDDVTPVTTRDILVFVFTNLVDDGTFSSFDDGEVVVLPTTESSFTLEDVDSGDISVIFLLDNAGDTADGTIDTGDPIAVLADPDDDLEDVRAGLTVTIERVDINFTDEELTSGLAAGTAEAEDIDRVAAAR